MHSLLSKTEALKQICCPASDLLHVGIDFTTCCINVRPPLLRNEGQEMLSVVSIFSITDYNTNTQQLSPFQPGNQSNVTNVPLLLNKSLESNALLFATFENQK